MNKRSILGILVILVILVAVVLLKNCSQETPRSLVEEYELKPLVPEGFLVSEVTQLELYSPKDEEKKVSLSKIENEWKITSKFDAPGDKEKINTFLEKIKHLEGELRSDSKEVLSDFELAEGQGIHISISRGKKPPVHLIVGKKMGREDQFVRRENQSKVYVVHTNLNSEMEVDGEDPPQSSVWVEKTILDLDKEKVEKVTLKYPDKEIGFRKEKKEPISSSGADKEEGESEPEGETVWRVAEGKVPAEFKEDKFERLLENLASLEADDVVDPQKYEEWGLDRPGYSCEIELGDGKERKLIASRQEISGPGYAIADDNRKVVYEVSSYNFEDIFPEGEELFELKGLDLDKEKIVEVVLKDGGQTYRFTKDEEKGWQLKEPLISGEVQTDTVEEIVEKFASLELKDFAQGSTQNYGLQEPSRTLRVTLTSGEEHSLALGNNSLVIEGTYVRLDEQDTIYAIKESLAEKLFPEPETLFLLPKEEVEADTEE